MSRSQDLAVTCFPPGGRLSPSAGQLQVVHSGRGRQRLGISLSVDKPPPSRSAVGSVQLPNSFSNFLVCARVCGVSDYSTDYLDARIEEEKTGWVESKPHGQAKRRAKVNSVRRPLPIHPLRRAVASS